ncbi:MAG: sugar transferase [Zoogloeaceae bacterium]|jgi:lipopolysaccharide/colanic/teichoic acid biosynthesis glycosyltransferase|nr:sugar transferase [Zoogloeaceae bacterium]
MTKNPPSYFFRVTEEERAPRQYIDRRNKILRQQIEQAKQTTNLKPPRGWICGRVGGRPWALSRSNRLASALIAFLLLLALSPLLIVIAVAIKLTSCGPVFFVQQRTGFCGRRFGMIKFRTMTIDAEARKASVRHLNKHAPDSVDFKIDRDPRITGIGGFLRRTSLDELPNLFNVVFGQMRLVGPRPTSFHAQTYKTHHLVRLSVYPGITGLWQISGRSNLDFNERVALDLHYIRQQSPWLDLKILLMTPLAVFRAQGAS